MQSLQQAEEAALYIEICCCMPAAGSQFCSWKLAEDSAGNLLRIALSNSRHARPKFDSVGHLLIAARSVQLLSEGFRKGDCEQVEIAVNEIGPQFKLQGCGGTWLRKELEHARKCSLHVSQLQACKAQLTQAIEKKSEYGLRVGSTAVHEVLSSFASAGHACPLHASVVELQAQINNLLMPLNARLELVELWLKENRICNWTYTYQQPTFPLEPESTDILANSFRLNQLLSAARILVTLRSNFSIIHFACCVLKIMLHLPIHVCHRPTSYYSGREANSNNPANHYSCA